MNTNLSAEASSFVEGFIRREKLPDSYRNTVLNFYAPLAQRIMMEVRRAEHVPVIGINGAQGTGKSTCAACVSGLLGLQGLRVLVLSIDDLYVPRSTRQALAETAHPLLETRGVPGTHEMERFKSIVALARGASNVPVEVPRFDKGTDDRCARGTAFPADGVDVILFEGWCIGARPQDETDLSDPINELERTRDPDGGWRCFVNGQLAGLYAEAFELIDYLVMLKPPAFEVVYRWRGEQEAKLRARLKEQGIADSAAMNETELAHFISHYERLTRWMFDEMPERADEVFLISEEHEVYANRRNEGRPSRWLVSTDLDATLLDEAYSWESARPALKRLAESGAVLVLNSSKTLREMQQLAVELSEQFRFRLLILVAENGGVLALPKADGAFRVQHLGLSRAKILAVAHRLRAAEGYAFEGFSDMSAERVVQLTGLSWDAADLAMDRQATEPILWTDSDDRWADFEAGLSAAGIRAVRGGRFIHLMGLTDKAEGQDAALAFCQSEYSQDRWASVALGDSPNDLGMLNAADVAVVIPNPAHQEILSPNSLFHIHPESPGPQGWNEAVLSLLAFNNQE